MWCGIVSLFPEMFQAITASGITGRAVRRGHLALEYWDPRDFSHDVHRTVDDKAYGGGPGLVLKPEPVSAAIAAAKAAAPVKPQVIYVSPQGRRFDHAAALELSQTAPALIFVSGRYEGLDQRCIDAHVDAQWSIGDYVLSGGELASMVMIDAISRLLPGVLGDAASAQDESFADALLEYPQYTRPALFAGQAVPEILLSGDHQAIARWRRKQSLGRTWLLRADLLAQHALSADDEALLAEFKTEYKIKVE